MYENGEYVEAFKKERSLVRMNKWLDDRLPDEPQQNEVSPPEVGSGSAVDDDTAEDPAPARNAEDEVQTTMAEAQRTAVVKGNEQPSMAAGNGRGAAQTTGNNGAIEAQATAVDTEDKNVIAGHMRNLDDTGTPLLRVQQHQKRTIPNPEGQVQHLKSDQLEALISPIADEGPTFVKYYAPWCSHCKRLAPVWTELAQRLKHRVNVVEFNCDASYNKAMCRKQGITGYPTLIFHQGGEKAEYNGGRSLSQLEAFANKAAMA